MVLIIRLFIHLSVEFDCPWLTSLCERDYVARMRLMPYLPRGAVVILQPC